jgi:very-short-patch-repair endonuclease
MLQGDTGKARKLRKSMSLPEVLIWRELRQYRKTAKFRRQHSAGPYVLDFYCHEARLAVEIDGEAHNRGDQPELDVARDSHFNGRGIRTLRIPAKAVLDDLLGVVQHILAVANERIVNPPL